MIKENVIFSLINTEHYAFMLKNLPHRKFEDLSIVYYEFEPTERMYHLIGNDYMERANLCEEELYDLAYENTKRLMPPVVVKMCDLILEANERLGVEQEAETPKDALIYVIRNEGGRRGAALILYDDIMREVSEKLGGDCYLIPSSMHEFIAMPKDLLVLLDDLQEHVHYTNLKEVDVSDRLSNQVYEYDSTTGQIKQATFSPYTKLDEGRPVWSDWILNDEPIPKTATDDSEQVNTDMQMGM